MILTDDVEIREFLLKRSELTGNEVNEEINLISANEVPYQHTKHLFSGQVKNTIALHGRTRSGRSVSLCVHNYRGYLSVLWQENHSHSWVENFLSNQIRGKISYELKELQPIWFYQKQPDIVLRIRVDSMYQMRQLEKILRSMRYPSGFKYAGQPLRVFETDISWINLFLWENGLSSLGWMKIQVPAKKQIINTPQTIFRNLLQSGEALTTSQLELHFFYQQDMFAKVDDQSMPPLKIVSFDTEFKGDGDHFCQLGKLDNPCILITVRTLEFGGESEDVAFSYDPSRHTDSEKTLIVAQNEKWMMEYFALYLIIRADYDILMGYNTYTFDYLYLWKFKDLVNSVFMSKLGRCYAIESVLTDDKMDSAAQGQNDRYILKSAGRVNLDLYVYIKSAEKLTSYTLNDVCKHFLGKQKLDICFSEVNRGWDAKDKEVISWMVKYGLEDANLPIELLLERKIIETLVQLARVVSCFLETIINRGKQTQIFNYLSRVAFTKGYYNNNPKCYGGEKGLVWDYEGATVLEPNKALHIGVVVLDFSSLYPSIMIAHNLCYSSYVPEERAAENPDEDYEKTLINNQTHRFIKSGIRKGFLPICLEDVLLARNQVKKEMKGASGKMKVILDKRQLALKVVANSVYGFTGVEAYGKMSMTAIAASTTYFGRQMIITVKDIINQQGHDVVYGDTDSVMYRANIPVSPTEPNFISECIKLGKRHAEEITTYFSEKGYPNIKLEFEKVFYRMLLKGKKLYAGYSFETEDKGSIMIKGDKSVRRDTTPMVTKLIENIYESLLRQGDIDRAVDTLMDFCQSLVDNQFAFEDYIYSKSLKRDYQNATNPPEQLIVSRKREKRSPGTGYLPGDRVKIVLVKGSTMHERAEDPEYAQKTNLMIDRQYYLDHHVTNAVVRIFQICSIDVNRLISTTSNLLYAKQNRMATLFESVVSLPRPKLITEARRPAKVRPVEFQSDESSRSEMMSDDSNLTDTVVLSEAKFENLPWTTVVKAEKKSKTLDSFLSETGILQGASKPVKRLDQPVRKVEPAATGLSKAPAHTKVQKDLQPKPLIPLSRPQAKPTPRPQSKKKRLVSATLDSYLS